MLAVTKTYVDEEVSELSQSLLSASGGNLCGPLYLNGDTTQALQAADKHYADPPVANDLPLTGGSTTRTLAAQPGTHGDLVMAMAIAFAVRKEKIGG
ncbi:MAG: hypothetical protein ACLGPM_04150 [Acidobacteriota bacterium]